MNSLERVLTALRREQPDRVPVCELIINEPTLSTLYGQVDYYTFAEKAELDAIIVFDDMIWDDLGNGLLRDEWGLLWQTGPGGLRFPAGGPIKTKKDLDNYKAPDPHADHRLDTMRGAVERFKGEKAVILCVHEAFEFSHYLYGMDNLLMAYIEDPEFVHQLARVAVDYKKAVINAAVDAGADVIYTGDDLAFKTAPLMSPAHFKEYNAPYLKEIADTAHARGVPLVKHTDGYIWPILDTIVECGIDAINPLEPVAGMDIGEVKQKYGDKVAVVGNIDCTELLCNGTREEVVDAVKETIAKASVGGGHILSSSNSIHPGVKPENFKTMLEAAREFGTYPLDEKMVEEYQAKNYIAKYL